MDVLYRDLGFRLLERWQFNVGSGAQSGAL
jgi:hypothetical protein